jgi:hypothetical protein
MVMVKVWRPDTPRSARCRVGPAIAASMGAMSDTLARPDQVGAQAVPPRAAAPPPGPSQPSRPRALVGIAVALWSALLGLACLVSLTLAAWITAAHHETSMRPALATAIQAWLLANHTGLAISGGWFSIVPLGLTIGLVALLVRAGRQAARLSGALDPLDCLATAFAVATPYAVVAALLTKPARWGQVHPEPLQALAGGFVLAFGCAAFGALRETGQGAVLKARLPVDVGQAVRAGLAATAVVVGVATVLVVVSLATHADRAVTLTSAVHGGVFADVLMVMVSIAYLPNAVMWAGAFSLGPGFAVGTKTTVALGGVHLGAVPAVPLLAALPADGAPPVAGWLAIAAPIGAGLIAGWLIARSRPVTALPVGPVGRWWERHRAIDAAWGLAAGAWAAVLLGVLAWLSAGPLGQGRMAQLGPSPWRVAGAALVEIGLLAAATAWLLGLRHVRQLPQVITLPEPDAGTQPVQAADAEV